MKGKTLFYPEEPSLAVAVGTGNSQIQRSGIHSGLTMRPLSGYGRDINMNKKVMARSNEIYDKAFAEGETPNARVLWADQSRQYVRFSEIIHFLLPGTNSVLDVGCGNGELLNFLNFHGFTGRYKGIDIHPKLIGEAVARFPGSAFEVSDFFEQDPGRFESVVMSGVFNVNFDQDLAFVHRFIERMFELCEKRVVFNALSSHVNYRNPALFYVDPADLMRRLVDLTPRVELRHGFLPFNYTVCLHKNPEWQPVKG
jgi:SAM-dependent methyltransferase